MTLLGWLSGVAIGTLGVATVALGTGYGPWSTSPSARPEMAEMAHMHHAPALVHGHVVLGGRPLQRGLLMMQIANGPTLPVPVEGGHFHVVAPSVGVTFTARCLESGWESSPRSETLQAGPQHLQLKWENELPS